jgi:hypothetical protein
MESEIRRIYGSLGSLSYPFPEQTKEAGNPASEVLSISFENRESKVARNRVDDFRLISNIDCSIFFFTEHKNGWPEWTILEPGVGEISCCIEVTI